MIGGFGFLNCSKTAVTTIIILVGGGINISISVNTTTTATITTTSTMATTQTQTQARQTSSSSSASLATTIPPVSVNPHKDSFRSTWPLADRSTWNFYQRALVRMNLAPTDLGRSAPKHSKTDKTPHVAQWSQHVFILFHAIAALVVHQGIVSLTGRGLHPFWLVNWYVFAMNFTLIKEIKILTRLGRRHGFLDGDVHGRDGIPDSGVGKVFWSLYKTTGSRLAAMAWLSYSRDVAPADALGSWAWWAKTAVQIGLYQLVVDFYFYFYHRGMHDVPFLWRFHRTHHLTKHPNPLLSAYADGEQEVIEMMLVPLLSYATLRALGMPLGFYEWWICLNYVMYTEVWGHSGVRVHLIAPSTFAGILTALDMELAVEDHDLHHRRGWRKSGNYGKQTRVWDRLFGSCAPRIESHDANVDYVNEAVMPLF